MGSTKPQCEITCGIADWFEQGQTRRQRHPKCIPVARRVFHRDIPAFARNVDGDNARRLLETDDCRCRI